MCYLAPLNYDKFFKRVFDHLHIAKQFLEDFLGKEIEIIEKVNSKRDISDEATSTFFDFRCKIDGQFVIIEMQQWYKQDVIQRFYVYHCLNTGFQLENLPEKAIITDPQTKEEKVVKDYRRVEPVLTLIWMVDDNFGFTNDFMGYCLTPEIAINFIKNKNYGKVKIWRR